MISSIEDYYCMYMDACTDRLALGRCFTMAYWESI